MKRILSTCLVLVLSVAFAGCEKVEKTPVEDENGGRKTDRSKNGRKENGQKQPGEKTSPRKLAFVTNNAANFWNYAKKGCRKAEKELPDVKVIFRLPGDGSAARQTRICNDLMAMGIDGLAISPVDPVNEREMINKLAAEMLVICVDSDAPESDRACYVGTDNVAAGHQAGELIKEALPEGGEIMIFVGKRDAQNAKEREQGIREELSGSNIKILDVRTDDTDTARAKANALDAITNNPDIDCLVGLWNYNGPACLSAVKQAGKVGEVKIVCFDAEEDTLQGIKDGAIHGTVVQQPFEFGYQAMKIMNTILEGDKSVIPTDETIIIETKKIKKQNVDKYWSWRKELLAEK